MLKQYFLKYNEFLNESLSSARKKFVDGGLIPQELFDDLQDIDPTPTKKYLDKICAWYKEHYDAYVGSGTDYVDGDMEEIEKYIYIFHRLLPKLEQKDINKYGSFKEFKELLDNTESNTAKKKAITKGIKVVFENEDVQVTNPRTYEESCILGAGTKWCTTSEGSPSHWDRYTIEDSLTFYYIWFKKEEDKRFYKVAVGVDKNDNFKEIYDALDDEIRLDVFIGMVNQYGIPNDIFVSDIPVQRQKIVRGMNNNIVKIMNYNEEGKLDGEYKEFFIDGTPSKILNYKDGKLHGDYTVYYQNGQIDVKQFYKDDKAEGKFLRFYRDGKPMIESYLKGGKTDGEFKKYWGNGQLETHCFFKDGEKDGPLKRWDNEGNPLVDMNYKNGKLHGEYKSWFSVMRNGETPQIHIHTFYKNGLIDGKYIEYMYDGDVYKTDVYEMGKII